MPAPVASAAAAAVLQRPKERAPYQPFGAARRAWRSRRPEVLLAGPGDTGKSRLWLEKLHYCADKYPRARCLIVRKTRASITQSAMVTYEQRVLPEGWLETLIHWNTTDQQYEYPNGSIIAVAGMDNPAKLLSSEWDIIYVPEATELSENDWEILGMRCRNGVMPYQQLCGDCNPGPPTHWLKQRCDRGQCLMLESRHEDNPSITPERLARLASMTGVRRARLYEGKWVAAEGMVYEEWDGAVHKVSRQQLIAWRILTEDEQIDPRGTKQVIAGVDWGWSNPGTIQVYALDGDGRLYLIHEVYQTQRTDDWWTEQGRELKARYGIAYFICDPAMPAYLAKFRAAGLMTVEADHDIVTGINDARERLQLADDGRPRFYLYEYALKERDEGRVESHQPFSFEGEILEYAWPKAVDGKPVKEMPVKLNDHAMDAWRYVCRHLAGPTGAAHIAALKERALVQKRRSLPPAQGMLSDQGLMPQSQRQKGWWE
jgi:PBSX family phage terminase large subunit